VQQWLEELPPTEWGWELLNEQLQPVLTRQPPAPEKLLSLISCNCKSGCERSCGCKKSGLFYVAIAMEMVAAILKNQSLVYQKLMEIMTLMQKETTMTLILMHWYLPMKHLISRWQTRILLYRGSL